MIQRVTRRTHLRGSHPIRKTVTLPGVPNKLSPAGRLRYLDKVRRSVWNLDRGSTVRWGRHSVSITDGPNFYMQFKDEFVQRVYHFESDLDSPRIVDGGANIGMSVLYFKSVYPAARVLAFEPDPDVFAILEANVERNELRGVTLINAGLDCEEGMATFTPDRGVGGRVTSSGEQVVRTCRLSSFLEEPTDLVKLNIEGKELDVLREVQGSGKLDRAEQIILEYHNWPGRPQLLGSILGLLVEEGFTYRLHDFDAETSPITKPPVSWSHDHPWFCLVYAHRSRAGLSPSHTTSELPARV